MAGKLEERLRIIGEFVPYWKRGRVDQDRLECGQDSPGCGHGGNSPLFLFYLEAGGPRASTQPVHSFLICSNTGYTGLA